MQILAASELLHHTASPAMVAVKDDSRTIRLLSDLPAKTPRGSDLAGGTRSAVPKGQGFDRSEQPLVPARWVEHAISPLAFDHVSVTGDGPAEAATISAARPNCKARMPQLLLDKSAVLNSAAGDSVGDGWIKRFSTPYRLLGLVTTLLALTRPAQAAHVLLPPGSATVWGRNAAPRVKLRGGPGPLPTKDVDGQTLRIDGPFAVSEKLYNRYRHGIHYLAQSPTFRDILMELETYHRDGEIHILSGTESEQLNKTIIWNADESMAVQVRRSGTTPGRCEVHEPILDLAHELVHLRDENKNCLAVEAGDTMLDPLAETYSEHKVLATINSVADELKNPHRRETHFAQYVNEDDLASSDECLYRPEFLPQQILRRTELLKDHSSDDHQEVVQALSHFRSRLSQIWLGDLHLPRIQSLQQRSLALSNRYSTALGNGTPTTELHAELAKLRLEIADALESLPQVTSCRLTPDGTVLRPLTPPNAARTA